ncbi:two-component system response regulator YesN [Bacillus mesophilus]|uniref:Response regulator n=1 Tax=Bacillus mesophilus TaxID=1808955 RepID=A0A6M0QAT8_9BACI|nr:response regulator [Bacillus mesophilus]MBM7662922.1 two-component system response regulator YesN [Bacillus mesophilus]NEY73511.1 response regulator [Bacillus mesophilus]
MYKVLIVDDEKNIRLGIQAMVKREFADVFEILVASDGQEAMEIIKQEPIDILITDIKMPRVDGITLIQEVQEMKVNISVIILSGHDDFEYAKAAIKSNVKDYLLKPVNRSELFQSINKVLEELGADYEKGLEQLDELRTSQLNLILLNQNIDEDEIQRICLKTNLPEYPDGYYVDILVSKSGMEPIESLHRIKYLLEKRYGQETKHHISFNDKYDNVVLITPDGSLFDYITEKLKDEKYFHLFQAVSEKQVELKKLKEGYNQASQAKKYQFLFPRCQLIQYENIKGKHFEREELPEDMIYKISNMLGTGRDKELKYSLLNIFDYEKISSLGIGYMEAIGELINKHIFDSFFNKLGEESIEIFKLYSKVGDMYNYKDFHDYYYAVEDLVMRLHEYVKQVKSVYSDQKYMGKAIKYIEENFHTDLNLAVVSNYISVNYSYFSHTFKEFTGSNFVDYVKKIRINEAKKLLKETDYKVFEIGEMVGYKNSKQFARVFRELEGISPKEFRSQN